MSDSQDGSSDLPKSEQRGRENTKSHPRNSDPSVKLCSDCVEKRLGGLREARGETVSHISI